MAQDYSFMQNQFSLVEGHRGIKCRGVERKRALRGALSRAARRLIRGWKRLGFFDLHLDLAALERARTRLVAQHFGAALFTQVTLA
jgi:hypothetical protein